MYGLIVTNGAVADDRHVLPLDIAVKDKKTGAVGTHGQFSETGAARVVDASGKYVLPDENSRRDPQFIRRIYVEDFWRGN